MKSDVGRFGPTSRRHGQEKCGQHNSVVRKRLVVARMTRGTGGVPDPLKPTVGSVGSVGCGR